MLRHLALAVLLLVPALARAEEGGEQGSSKRTEQTKREAGDLLRMVWRDFDVQMSPCTFATTWATIPVDVSLAQTYLGSRLQADLLAPNIGAKPADIIDPARQMPLNFCTDFDQERLWRQGQADFRNGLLSGDANDGRQSRSFRMTRIVIAMPVFDAEFNTAVVVIGKITRSVRKTNSERAKSDPRLYDDAGYSRHPFVSGAGYSVVYRKQDGQWIQIFQIESFLAH